MISKHYFWLSLLLLVVPGAAVVAQPNWNQAQTVEVSFFSPGVATWEGLLTKASHKGAMAIRNRESCLSCHQGDELSMAEKLTKETDNLFYRQHQGAAHWQTKVQLATDDSLFYIRVATNGLAEGRVSALLDNGAFESSALAGCWAACHQDMKGMPAAGELVLSKYLSRSRSKNTATGGGENLKSDNELAQLLSDGQFVELLGAGFVGSEAQAIQGYVLEKRHMAAEPSVAATMVKDNGNDYVVISRPLKPAASGQKALETGVSYSIALALHQGRADGGDHLVSFPLSFRLLEDGVIKVAKDEN